EETLITFRRSDPVSVHFQVGLQQLGVEWFSGIEVNSARLIECYVAQGCGIGLSVATPGFKTPKGIRALKLPNFPKVMIGAAWTGKLSAIAQQFMAEVEREATSLRKSRVAAICRFSSAPQISASRAPVAQLDRASDYGSEGLRFESPRARNFLPAFQLFKTSVARL